VTASGIAAALGAARRCGGWWSCRCPAHDDRSPSLSLRDGERSIVVHCHAGCDPRDVLAELRRRGLIAGGGSASSDTRPAGGDGDDAARRIALARRIWGWAGDATGSPVVRYLAGRGITIPPPASLRWAPSLRRPDGTCGPAMVARIDDLAGQLIGVHRTWLNRGPDGTWRRCDRAMLGRAAGGAVRLAPAAETLLVAEGIETAMAAMTATAQPAWAALSTSGMAALILPPAVRTVVILADHDASGAGERAARAAAARWLGEGRRVRIAMPPVPGTDVADVLVGRGHAPIVEARDAAA
jgi:putative DNA primase/helicase